MTAVAASAGQFAAACLLGMGLGAGYELLRPLRSRLKGLSDALFVALALYAWLHLAFGICGGDIRMAQPAGLLLGALAFRLTLGKLMQAAVTAILRAVGRFARRLLRPVTRLLKKIWQKAKNYLHLGENRLQ